MRIFKKELKITEKLLKTLKNLDNEFDYRGEHFEMVQRTDKGKNSCLYYEGSKGNTIEMNCTLNKMGEDSYIGLRRIDNVLIND